MARLAYLSSLREISVVDTQGSVDECLQRIPVSVEPSFVALGPQHVAVGMNIRIWLYRYGDRTEAFTARLTLCAWHPTCVRRILFTAETTLVALSDEPLFTNSRIL